MNKIKHRLCTCSYEEGIALQGKKIVDVRNLIDGSANSLSFIRKKIDEAVTAYNNGHDVAICCDFGISRSNSIATGALCRIDSIPFSEALRTVLEATDYAEIKIQFLSLVRSVVVEKPSRKKTDSENILILGGSGFVGGRLVDKLSRDSRFRVHAPSSSQLDLGKGSVLLDDYIYMNDIDCVVNFAHSRIYTNNSALGESLNLLKNIIDACVNSSVRLLVPSSWVVYSGYKIDTGIFDEEVVHYPSDTYSECKVYSELMIRHHIRENGLKCSIVRLPALFGKGSNKPKFIFNFIEKAIRGAEIFVHEYTNGCQGMDLMHVDEAVDFLTEFLLHWQDGLFNISSKEIVRTDQIAEFIIRHFSSKSKIIRMKIDARKPTIILDSNKAESAFRWKPKTSVLESLEKFIRQVSDDGQ